MRSILISVLIFIGGFIFAYELLHWIIVEAMAIINSDAVYNNTSKKVILKLAQKDKIWRDVAKVLELESEVN